MDHTTLQRNTDTFALEQGQAKPEVTLDSDDQLIEVFWPDGDKSLLSAYSLLSIKQEASSQHHLAPKIGRILWDKDRPLENLPTVDHSRVMSEDSALLDWLEKIHSYGFCVVEGVPSTEQATADLAKRIGIVQETIFGDMWKLSAELTEHGDTAYTTQYLEPHTDGTYYHDAAGLQMFNCFEFDGKGGESVQVDAFAIADQIKTADPEAYQTLCQTIVPGHYIEPQVHLRAERPTFRLDSNEDLAQVSFNNYDRAPMMMTDNQTKKFHHAYGLFHELANNQDNWIKIPLRPGMTLIFDNWRNMHGRMGYVGKRVFYGCYHNMAVFESKLRVLQSASARLL
jgi:trimethyllysine dioxygenase